MDNRDAFVAKLKAKLDEWNADIDKMDAQAREAKADRQIEINNRITELRRRRDEADERLMRLQQSSGDGWEDMRQDLEDTWDRITSAFSQAWDQIGRSKAA